MSLVIIIILKGVIKFYIVEYNDIFHSSLNLRFEVTAAM